MLRAIPKGFFSHRFTISRDGGAIAHLRTSGWREKAELAIDGRELHLYREKKFAGRFLLDLEGKPLASAAKPSAFRSRFELTLGNHRFDIHKKGFFSNSYMIIREGEVFGRIAKVGVIGYTTDIDLPDEWPVAIQVFVFWLVLLMWKRMEAAVVGGG